MTARHLRRLCRLDHDAVALLDRAYDRLHLSARGCDRVIKVAQTIADLEGSRSIARVATSPRASPTGSGARR